MPFTRPSLGDLIARGRADIRGRLGIAGALLRRAMADVLVSVWMGAVHMLHGHLEWLGKQLFPDTSEREFLLRQASLYGIFPTPATFAAGNVIATGVNTSVIPIGTVIQGEGHNYETTAGAIITAGTATIPVEAVLAGAAANVAAGVVLAFESPLTGVDSAVTVATGGIAGGNDEETTEGTRDRLILRLTEPPEGGADQDYKAWALAVAGVTRVWVYPVELGLGTVVVRFVMDDLPDIFPDVAAVAAVQAALDAERPITAEVTAVAPTPLAVDFTISIVPDTSATRLAVTAELEDLLVRDAAPANLTGLGTIKFSRINTAIGVAEGVDDYSVLVPAADVVPTSGQLAILGTITWV